MSPHNFVTQPDLLDLNVCVRYLNNRSMAIQERRLATKFSRYCPRFGGKN